MLFNIFGIRSGAVTLCSTCIHSHVAMSCNGKRLTSCAFGGVLRPIAFEVVDCSSYFDRAKVRSTVVSGFLRQRRLDAA